MTEPLAVTGIGRHAAEDVICVRFSRPLSDAEINRVRRIVEWGLEGGWFPVSRAAVDAEMETHND